MVLDFVSLDCPIRAGTKLTIMRGKLVHTWRVHEIAMVVEVGLRHGILDDVTCAEESILSLKTGNRGHHQPMSMSHSGRGRTVRGGMDYLPSGSSFFFLTQRIVSVPLRLASAPARSRRVQLDAGNRILSASSGTKK